MLEKIGILGGTFNPVHNVHLQMAKIALQEYGLTKIYFMVAGSPPHKTVDRDIAPHVRLQMTHLAVKDEDRLIASDLEVRRGGKSYMVDTVNEMRAMHPAASLFLLIGGDMLHEIHTWHESAQLLKNVSIIAFQHRNDHACSDIEELSVKYGARILLSNAPLSDISSSIIRARIENAQPVEEMVPNAVETYIYEEGLYLPQDVKRLQEKCRSVLTEGRYSHTMGVVKTALSLAERYNADPYKVRIAAMLHDYGRSVEWDALMHATVGEKLIKEDFQIHDEEILSAVRLHTTLAREAGILAKIVYLADMIEPRRHFPGVNELRRLAEVDLDAAVAKGITHTIAYLNEKKIPVQPNSIEALDALTESLRRQGKSTLLL